MKTENDLGILTSRIGGMKLNADQLLDCSGLVCPMPIVKLSKAVKTMEDGQTIEVLADDPAFERDVTAWVAMSDCKLLKIEKEGNAFKAYIEVHLS